MPELPEVETIRRTLCPLVVGASIEKACFQDQLALRRMSLQQAKEAVEGQSVVDIIRKGKYLVFALTKGIRMVIHLRMTGRLFVLPGQDHPPTERISAWLALSNHRYLYFADTRRFGTIDIGTQEELQVIKGLCNLGPDPTAASWGPELLTKATNHRSAPIKSLLLNQAVVAGLGNIYADESLFCAGVHPQRAGNTLTAGELDRLTTCIRRILEEATEFQGTTFRDFQWGYRQTGSFQEYLQVYGRAGQSCRRCATSLASIKIAGRTSVFCPHCQPEVRKPS